LIEGPGRRQDSFQPDLPPTTLPEDFPPNVAHPQERKREVEERMKSMFDVMSAYNLIDFKFWLENAAVLFVATVGRDAFFQQWLGSSH
jgi:hypothetical protein